MECEPKVAKGNAKQRGSKCARKGNKTTTNKEATREGKKNTQKQRAVYKELRMRRTDAQESSKVFLHSSLLEALLQA